MMNWKVPCTWDFYDEVEGVEVEEACTWDLDADVGEALVIGLGLCTHVTLLGMHLTSYNNREYVRTYHYLVSI